MANFIDPEIQRSFRPSSVGFVSRSVGGLISCPPYVIASVARRQVVEGAELTLPEGYDNDTLSGVQDLTGRLEQDVRISSRRADELAQIGRQILILDEQGQIQPPLTAYQKQSIGHLVTLVDQMPTE